MIITNNTNNNNNTNNLNNSQINNSQINNSQINNLNKMNNNTNNNIYYKYVDTKKLNDNLECVICFQQCEDPVIEPKCQQMFCKDCLVASLEKSNGLCPFCKAPTDSSTITLPPKFITNQLNELKVTCTLCEDINGAKEMSRRDFKSHLETECKAKCMGPCGQEILRRDLATHVCPFVNFGYLTTENHVLSKSGRYLNTPQVINCLLESTNEKIKIIGKPSLANKFVFGDDEVSPPAKDFSPQPFYQFPFDGREIHVFNAHHDFDEIPACLSSVAFPANTGRSMFYLSSFLHPQCKELFLLDGFDAKVCPQDIPDFVETLHVFNVKYPLTAHCIPSSVKNLHFHDGYAHPFDQGVITQGVESLYIHNVQHPITQKSLPSSIKLISFNSGYPHPIRPGTIAKTIQTIHIGNVKEPLIPGSIPKSSKHSLVKLFIYGGYKHTLRPGVIPLIESLSIGETSKPILADSIPVGVQNLHFTEDYVHLIHSHTLPVSDSLRYLCIPNLDQVQEHEFSKLKFNDCALLHFNSNPSKHKFSNIKTKYVSKFDINSQILI